MNSNILEVVDLKKNYGKTEVLKGISFYLKKGEICGLIGNNGEGKSTLMRTILGLMKPTSGKIVFISEKKFTGYMPQVCKFNDRLSVSSTINFFSKLRQCSPVSAFELCKKFCLDTEKKVKLLSPGQQKKLQIALATIGDPDVYILDEPTAGLDPSSSLEVLEMIKEINSRGNSVLISSHILQDLNDICTEIIILKDGHIKSGSNIQEVICIRVGSLSKEQSDKISEKYKVRINSDNTLIELNEKKDRVPEITRDFVRNDIDIYEISYGNLKQIALNMMGEGEA